MQEESYDNEDEVERIDISDKITPTILSNLVAAKWTLRRDASKTIKSLIKGKHVTSNGLDDMVKTLASRTKDPHKKLIRSFIKLIGLLGTALGPEAKRFAKTILPAVILCLKDKAIYNREAALNTIQAWSDSIGYEPVIRTMGASVQEANTELRKSACSWIAQVRITDPIENAGAIVDGLFKCMHDKIKEVRAEAEMAFANVINRTSPAERREYKGNLHGHEQQEFQEMLDKHIERKPKP